MMNLFLIYLYTFPNHYNWQPLITNIVIIIIFYYYVILYRCTFSVLYVSCLVSGGNPNSFWNIDLSSLWTHQTPLLHLDVSHLEAFVRAIGFATHILTNWESSRLTIVMARFNYLIKSHCQWSKERSASVCKITTCL